MLNLITNIYFLIFCTILSTFVYIDSFNILGISVIDKVFYMLLPLALILLSRDTYKKIYINRKLLIILFIYMIAFFINSLLSTAPYVSFLSSFNILIQTLYFISFIFILEDDNRSYYKILKTIFFLIFFLLVIYFIESYSLFFRAFLDSYRGSHRKPMSLFTNPNSFSVVVSVSLFLAFVLKVKKYINKGVFALFVLVAILAVFKARSSTAVGLLLIQIILFFIFQFRFRKLVYLFICFLPLLIAFFYLNSFFEILNINYNLRADIWNLALEMFKDSPVFGVGNGVFQRTTYNYTDLSLLIGMGTHSFYVSVFVEQGLVSVFLLLYVVFLFTNYYKKAPMSAQLNYVFLMILAVSQLVENIIIHVEIFSILLILIFSKCYIDTQKRYKQHKD